MSLIACKNASFGYEGNAVIGNLDFEINPGDYLCIVGENGSGKSTLIKGLLGLKTAVGGNVFISKEFCLNQTGYLPQQTAAQKDFPASVYEAVISGRLGQRGFLPFYSRKDKYAAQENMRSLNIWDLRNKCYAELSGGQQRRTLLARALCAAGKLLLLDEPASGLDPTATREMYGLIKTLNAGGMSIIMVSHDINAALKCASHILHLQKCGAAQNLNCQNTQAFFGKTQDYIKSSVAADFTGGKIYD
ncbi:MAG: metal ABC transporter ATP-binding protein [Endomicrobium sp.]|jgi:zinc transport system ATP-binding protein|nr:metal ABC transporter ATP-binding protein [Endomicrobium sp.]